MLLEKYEPRSAEQCIASKKHIEEIKSFVKGFTKGKALILHGPTGCGKSLCARLAAAELGYEICEFSRLDANIKSFLSALQQQSFFFRGKMVLVDLDAEGERSMHDLVKASSHPVIFTALNAYDYRIRSLAKLVKFSKINYMYIASFLRQVCEKEGIKYDHPALMKFSQFCDGDVRAALIDIECMGEVTEESLKNFSQRERKDNIFNTLKVIFKTSSIENIFAALGNSDKDSSEVISWLHENLPEEYTDIEDLAYAYDFLSKTDIFSGRVLRRQAMSLMKYNIIGIAGIALAKQKRYNKFYVYRAPRFRRSETNAVLEKVSEKLHVSRKKARSCLPLLRLMLEKNNSLADYFSFDSADMNIVKVFF